MGGGLLQKVNRDTMQFATKLSHIEYADGSVRDIAKMPKTDPEKSSLPGVLGVKRLDGVPTVFPAQMVSPTENLLKVVYDCGLVKVRQCLLQKPFQAACHSRESLLQVIAKMLTHCWYEIVPPVPLTRVSCSGLPMQDLIWDDFETVRKRVADEWQALPKTADVISEPVRELTAHVRREHFDRDQLVGLDS